MVALLFARLPQCPFYESINSNTTRLGGRRWDVPLELWGSENVPLDDLNVPLILECATNFLYVLLNFYICHNFFNVLVLI